MECGESSAKRAHYSTLVAQNRALRERLSQQETRFVDEIAKREARFSELTSTFTKLTRKLQGAEAQQQQSRRRQQQHHHQQQHLQQQKKLMNEVKMLRAQSTRAKQVELQLIERMAMYASQLTATGRAVPTIMPRKAIAAAYDETAQSATRPPLGAPAGEIAAGLTARVQELDAQLARAEQSPMAAAYDRRVDALEATVATMTPKTPLQLPQRTARQKPLVQQLLIARAPGLAASAPRAATHALSLASGSEPPPPESPWAALLSSHNAPEGEEQGAGGAALPGIPLTPLAAAGQSDDAQTHTKQDQLEQLEQLKRAVASLRQRLNEAETGAGRRASESAAALAAALAEKEQLVRDANAARQSSEAELEVVVAARVSALAAAALETAAVRQQLKDAMRGRALLEQQLKASAARVEELETCLRCQAACQAVAPSDPTQTSMTCSMSSTKLQGQDPALRPQLLALQRECRVLFLEAQRLVAEKRDVLTSCCAAPCTTSGLQAETAGLMSALVTACSEKHRLQKLLQSHLQCGAQEVRDMVAVEELGNGCARAPQGQGFTCNYN